jgi:hypothetical protein
VTHSVSLYYKRILRPAWHYNSLQLTTRHSPSNEMLGLDVLYEITYSLYMRQKPTVVYFIYIEVSMGGTYSPSDVMQGRMSIITTTWLRVQPGFFFDRCKNGRWTDGWILLMVFHLCARQEPDNQYN